MNKKSSEKSNFYSLSRILKQDAVYNVIMGERSNGKTYACLEYGLRRFWETGEQLAIVRRWDTDFKGKNGQVMYDGHVSSGVVEEITGGEWTSVFYWAGRWYLCNYDEDGTRIKQETPFAYGFSINAMEHDKSTSYPNITTIVFDEFITRQSYIPDEFVLFMNVISTIVRHRSNVKIFMLGNTVNKYCPYFKEMGLTHITEQKQGTIDLYRYGSSKLTVAVEYCKPLKKGKKSDVYFAFDNPKLSMITGGEWEIDIYPHCPHKYLPKEVVFTYFILFDDNLLQCEIIHHDNDVFTYIHRKTGEIKHPGKDLVFSPDFSPSPLSRRRITKPEDRLGEKILSFYKRDKVFYQDNEVGEVVRNYILWCK